MPNKIKSNIIIKMDIQKMRDIYYNPSIGFRRRDLFSQQTKDLIPQPKRKDIEAFLNEQLTYKQHYPTILGRTRRPQRVSVASYFPIYSKSPLDTAQIDLMDVHSLAPANDHVNFLLCMIDVLTKKAWVRPLKDKSMKNIIPASEDIFKEATPRLLCSDAGSEFVGTAFKKLAEKHHIELSYTTADKNRMGVVERFNKSLRSLMERYMTAYRKTARYINVLPDLVKNYNSRYHTGIRTSPDAITPHDIELTHERQVEQYLRAMRHEHRYQIGDNVHYLLNKELFDKGSRPNWSATTHKVVMIHKHSYVLDNGNTYKYYYLQPSTIAPEEEYYVPPPIAEERPQPVMTRPEVDQTNRQERHMRGLVERQARPARAVRQVSRLGYENNPLEVRRNT